MPSPKPLSVRIHETGAGVACYLKRASKGRSSMSETIDKTQRNPPRYYPAEKARQGEIILKSNWARAVFITGLFGSLVIVIILAIYLATLG
jgi:hypothetical protein